MNSGLYLLLLCGLAPSLFSQTSSAPPDWQGTLTLDFQGKLHSQGLANKIERIQHNDVPTIFVKEKSEMSLNARLLIEIWFNEAGEFGYRLVRSGEASDQFSLEQRQQFFGDEEVKGQRMKLQDLIKTLEVQEAHGTALWSGEWAKAEQTGKLTLEPKGKIKKKGSVKLAGEWLVPFEFKGKMEKVFDKQPDPEKKNHRAESSDYTRHFEIPLSFALEIELKKKPVSGDFQVRFEIKNPYSLDIPELQGNQKLFSEVQIKGSYQLRPAR